MLKDFLTLTTVTVSRKSIAVINGDAVESVVTTLIPRSVLWSPSQSKSYISDKLASVSSHVLVTLPSYYAFNNNDDYITYNGQRYKIKGFDDVMNMGEIMVVGLEKII